MRKSKRIKRLESEGRYLKDSLTVQRERMDNLEEKHRILLGYLNLKTMYRNGVILQKEKE